jgi:hypothetical protein
MKGSRKPLGSIPCPGCPIYEHIPDEQFRFPSCELCHWPAIGVGATHVWRCAYCRHWNEHGLVRPRVSTVLLRVADIDPAARRLEIVDPSYGRYLLPRARSSPCRPGNTWRPGITALEGIPAWSGGPRWRRAVGRDHAGRPLYSRATVAGLPVLIVGGDRPYAYPLGLAEHDPQPCAFGSRVTRIACPCDQQAPCLHGQALYAHVVSPTAAPPVPAAPQVPASPPVPAPPVPSVRAPQAGALSRPAG